MTKDEAPARSALKLALEGAANYIDTLGGDSRKYRQALAQSRSDDEQPAIKQDLTPEPAQQQEPVVWMWRCKPYCDWPEWSVSLKRPADSGRDGHKRTEGYEDVPLYTSPPANKPWVGLTDDEIEEGLLRSNYAFVTALAWRQGVEWAEAKLREKNSD